MAMSEREAKILGTSDVIVVGSGLFGLTIAERIASVTTKSVAIIEKRSVIGGNAYSYFDKNTGIEIHKYGSHLFHTSNKRVWDYVNHFTSFTDYRHRVFTKFNGEVFSLPINLHTLSQFFGRDISPQNVHEVLPIVSASKTNHADNFQEKAIAQIGIELYSAFFKNYTQKQWQISPKDLPADIFGRLPLRFNFNSDYFDDSYQGLPSGGYSAWFSNMVNYENIEILLGMDYFDVRKDLDLSGKIVVYTGPLDRYFDYIHGELSWRTLDFEIETIQSNDFQGTSVMNYADLPPEYTRIHEFKHLHPERDYPLGRTVIAREYSRRATRQDEPYYPINSESDRSVLLKYRKQTIKEDGVFFGGRLGSYKYLDMHMAIASALTLFDNEIHPLLRRVES